MTKAKSKSKSNKKKRDAKKKTQPKSNSTPPQNKSIKSDRSTRSTTKEKASLCSDVGMKKEEPAKRTQRTTETRATKRRSERVKKNKCVTSTGDDNTREIPLLDIDGENAVVNPSPFIMECTESDEEANPKSDPAAEVEPESSEVFKPASSEAAVELPLEPDADCSPNDDPQPAPIDPNFDPGDDLKMDIDFDPDLLNQELDMNFDCFVDLEQLNLTPGSIEYLQSITLNDPLDPDVNVEESCVRQAAVEELHRIKIEETPDSTDGLQSQEVINCVCGYREEDGLMIQCDVCLMWQHALCCGMNSDSEVPENYSCIYCVQPVNVRLSQRFAYAKHFLTLSRFPRFSKRAGRDEDAVKLREALTTKAFELTADLRNIARMERTIRAKLSVAQEPDHPKLYMWSANWDEDQSEVRRSSDGPVGERPIESDDCRIRLLEKIDEDQRDLACRLSLVHDQIKRLEEGDRDRKLEEVELKRVLRMLIKDLETLNNAVTISRSDV